MTPRLEQPVSAIILTGFMGTGKSVVGRVVGEMLGLRWVDTDELIERRAGVSISTIFEREGEERFRELESEALREALEMSGAVVSTGGGILLRDENRALMRSAGPIICLTAPILGKRSVTSCANASNYMRRRITSLIRRRWQSGRSRSRS